VTYDSRHASIGEAADKNKGLAVLGFFFEVNILNFNRTLNKDKMLSHYLLMLVLRPVICIVHLHMWSRYFCAFI
jgi:hypothetical protein